MNVTRFVLSSSAGGLNGEVKDPDRPTKGTVGFFTHDWSARYKDYAPLLDMLVEEGYCAVAFNQRGHGGSPGTLNYEGCVGDTIDAYSMFHGTNNYLLGHSLGALTLGAANAIPSELPQPNGIILMEPVVHTSLLPVHLRLGVASAAMLSSMGVRLDLTSGLQKYAQTAGLHMNELFGNTAALKDMQLEETSIPLLYFLADNDRVLGCHTERGMARYKQAIDRIGPEVADGSAYVQGLNHCWNTEGYVPFFKEEKGKNREPIVERLVEFMK